MLNGLGIRSGINLEALVLTGAWICGELGRKPASKAGVALNQRIQDGVPCMPTPLSPKL